MKQVYGQLTGIDINNETKKWDERGKGYYGEYEVLKALWSNLQGDFKLLMNIEVPIAGRKTEIDLVVIHETGIYVCEVKYYKGTIYGDAYRRKWTQYFRTTSNSTFMNPMIQNDYHIKSLRELGIDIPMYSVIVFANDECTLKVEQQRNDVILTKLSELGYYLNQSVKNKNKVISLEQMDSLFQRLKGYSKLTEPADSYAMENKLSFNDMVESLKKDYKEKIIELDSSLIKEKRRYRRRLISGIIISFIILSVVFGSVMNENSRLVNEAKANEVLALNELTEMKNKFNAVDETSNVNGINMIDNFNITDVELSEHTLYESAYSISFKIQNNSDYTIKLLPETELIVQMVDGSVNSYSIFSVEDPYNSYFDKVYEGQSYIVAPIELLNITNEIAYIKLIKMELTCVEGYRTVTKYTDLELKVYEE